MWVFRGASDSNLYPAAYFTPEPLTTSHNYNRRQAARWRGGVCVISKCRATKMIIQGGRLAASQDLGGDVWGFPHIPADSQCTANLRSCSLPAFQRHTQSEARGHNLCLCLAFLGLLKTLGTCPHPSFFLPLLIPPSVILRFYATSGRCSPCLGWPACTLLQRGQSTSSANANTSV